MDGLCRARPSPGYRNAESAAGLRFLYTAFLEYRGAIGKNRHWFTLGGAEWSMRVLSRDHKSRCSRILTPLPQPILSIPCSALTLRRLSTTTNSTPTHSALRIISTTTPQPHDTQNYDSSALRLNKHDD